VIAFTGTLVVLLSHGFGRMSYSVILPSMREGIGLTYTEVGLIGTANFVGYLLLSLFGGFIAVRFGTRRTVFISLMAMGISLFFTGLVSSFATAFLMRLIAGMANGSAYIPMLALPAAWFSQRKRGFATGIITMGTGIGLSITGLLLPYIIERSDPGGWRYAWFSVGITVFILSFVSYALLRDSPHEMNTTMYGGDEEERYVSDSSHLSIWKMVVKELETWKLGLAYFMYGFSYIIYLTFFVAYLTNEIALPYEKAGALFAVLGLLSIPSGVIWGWISDALSRKNGLFFSFIVLALSYLFFALSRSVFFFYTSAILFGITLSSVPTIMAAAAGDVAGGKVAPATLGFITLFFGVGQCFGPGIAGWIKDITGTFVWSFLLSAIVSFLGASCSLLLKGYPRH
jgi:sugar phosphate permease